MVRVNAPLVAMWLWHCKIGQHNEVAIASEGEREANHIVRREEHEFARLDAGRAFIHHRTHSTVLADVRVRLREQP